MRSRKVYVVLILLGVVSVLSNCATVTHGTSQTVPVTSSPPGAKVYVNGAAGGVTPTTISLKRKENCILRIEKDEFQPQVIWMRHVSNKAGKASSYTAIVSLPVAMLSIWADYSSGGALSVVPPAVHADLLPISE